MEGIYSVFGDKTLFPECNNKRIVICIIFATVEDFTRGHVLVPLFVPKL